VDKITVEDLDHTKLATEADGLRSALLASISHDFRTPLSAILGAASTLHSMSQVLTESQKADLLATIIDESERLNRFLTNLLDMTRLKSGAVVPNFGLHDLGEVIGSALKGASKILAGHPVEVELTKEVPMVDLDPILFEQVLFNLLDNAAKYAPPGTSVYIRSWRDRDSIGLRVLDEGDGIPSGELPYIFDKFYRCKEANNVRAGTRLGLEISRGFIEAMHGTITAANRTDRSGAAFTIRLPIPAKTQKRAGQIGTPRLSAYSRQPTIARHEPQQ
jgi:two-component system sensor histidine kinase KdpD